MISSHQGDLYATPPNYRELSTESLRRRGGLILGTEIREPMADRLEIYSPYEVPPLYVPSVEIHEQPGPLLQHQLDVQAMHESLIDFELGSYVSPTVLRFIKNSIHARMTEQIGLNGACYNSRLKKRDGEALDESCLAALAGTGDVRQCYDAFVSFAMVSAPLAELTAIRDKRTEYIPDMCAEVSQLVGHDVSIVKPYRTEILSFDREPDSRKAQHLGAMRVKMKRHLGFMTDGTEIKQRTIAIIDLSAKSGIDPEITKAIFSAYEQNRQDTTKKSLGKITLDTDQESILHWLGSCRESTDANEERRIAYEKIPQVETMLDELVQREMSSDLVLARNETVYAYNKQVDDIIHSNA